MSKISARLAGVAWTRCKIKARQGVLYHCVFLKTLSLSLCVDVESCNASTSPVVARLRQTRFAPPLRLHGLDEFGHRRHRASARPEAPGRCFINKAFVQNLGSHCPTTRMIVIFSITRPHVAGVVWEGSSAVAARLMAAARVPAAQAFKWQGVGQSSSQVEPRLAHACRPS